MTELYRPSAGEHPITPPPELVRQWVANTTGPDYEKVIATQAARWGADQELIECLRYASDNGLSITRMSTARRPKQPSLKEQALAELESIMTELHESTGSAFVATFIPRALEALDD